MKRAFFNWSLGVALGMLPLAGGCVQGSAVSVPIFTNSDVTVTTNTASAAEAVAATTAPPPSVAQTNLENASGQIVATPQAPPSSVSVTGAAAEVAKLAQAGVDEGVMMAYVTNCTTLFGLTSDSIIYLNDIGVPGPVMTAMMQHDDTLKTTSSYASVAVAPPTDTNTVPEMAVAAPPPPVVESGQPQAANVSYTYFYDSLAPYGNWIDIGGYGLCWRPTVAVVNPGWQPYWDHGHWAYTDCGWYWASDYSWGWAPFHYGRWFHNRRWGWCWAPDTVWGPAWVSWRYTPDYCGWAPLPPAACFTPGFGFTYFGRSVGFSFGFGLASDCYTFVAIRHFHGRYLHRYRLPEREVQRFFHHTIVANRFREHNRTVINEGIPVSRIAAATRTEIRPMHLRDARNPASARVERAEQANGRTLAVFRPNLPPPTQRTRLVGQSVKPGLNNRVFSRPGVAQTVNRSESRRHTSNLTVRERNTEAFPVFRNRLSTPHQTETRNNSVVRSSRTEGIAASNAGERNNALILRGSERSTPLRRETVPPGSLILRGPKQVAQPPVVSRSSTPLVRPIVPAQPVTPARNNTSRGVLNPYQRRITPPVPQPQTREPVQRQFQLRRPTTFGGQVQQPVGQVPRPYVPPTISVRRQPTAPAYQQPRMFAPRPQPRLMRPVPQRPARTYRPPVRQARPPRFAPRPSPPPRPAPQRQATTSAPRPSKPGNNRHGR